MTPRRRPASLVAERAVRFLRERGAPAESLVMIREILATRVSDETAAYRLLQSAFRDDPRLAYVDGRWKLDADACAADAEAAESAADPDRVLLLIDGRRPAPRQPFELRTVAAVRLHEDTVVAACGGTPVTGREGETLRREMLDMLDGAVPVVHDPPGALSALGRWLEEPVEAPLSLRHLARARAGLPAGHDLETLAAKLGLPWRESEELLDQAEALDACLDTLRHPGESLEQLRETCSPGSERTPWERYAFDRAFLRAIPQVAGTYRFYDADGRLLYVGRSKNLRRRIGFYFREGGARRSARTRSLLESLHRIEYELLQSDLEAVLQEAIDIERRRPERNVQRHVWPRARRDRLRSILILEPATPPRVLKAYLLREGRLVGKVGIGPRGGGLARIERLLDDHFFSIPDGPTPAAGPDVDVELVARWLAQNRDQVVAFDPTNLAGAREVTDRLRYYLDHGALFDPDGAPVIVR